MNPTPISDFIENYEKSGASRFHMPGHRGSYKFDITEIDGAGSLFPGGGIVAESERTASQVFGFPTYYSTEGSSLAIKTMAALAVRGGNKRVIAARNAHVSFLSAAILLDLDVEWLTPRGASYLSCPVTADDVATTLDANGEPAAFVYVTTPDYVGNMLDVAPIARVCHERGTLLLVDNAHGAYLKFLTPSRHPIDLGADMCADSAHKTLPALTGAAYLHLSAGAAKEFAPFVKETMEVFGTTSPSYPILRSLDLINGDADSFFEKYAALSERVEALKESLSSLGFIFVGDESAKLTVKTKPYGYVGDAVAEYLISKKIHPEFHDPDLVTLMFSPENTEEDFSRLESALRALPRLEAINSPPPVPSPLEAVMTPREAFFAPREVIPVDEADGRVMASPSVSCPPAIPIAVSGEAIDREKIEAFKYYGIEYICVVK